MAVLILSLSSLLSLKPVRYYVELQGVTRWQRYWAPACVRTCIA